jgi:mannose-6-phosphate isomerase
MTDFGGNRVTQVDLASRSYYFSKAPAPYSYSFHRLSAGETFQTPDLGSQTVYVYELGSKATLRAVERGETLKCGDALQLEGEKVTLTLEGGEAAILVAGVAQKFSQLVSALTTAERLKKVVKPWGHELWINGEHPGYAIKQIMIKAPHKTSLQYHNFKQETNVLVSGTTKLHYKKNTALPNERVTSDDVASVELKAVSTVDVSPPTLHRLEAVTDLLLYEVSTPHLNDVIRVSDDTNRQSGRLDAEHAAGAARSM